MFRTKAFERRDNVLLFHFDCVGDHTRGLFEAEASVVVSPTHSRENVEGVLLVFHYDSTPEKPAFCVVMASVVTCGFPPLATITFSRTNIRHGAPDQVT